MGKWVGTRAPNWRVSSDSEKVVSSGGGTKLLTEGFESLLISLTHGKGKIWERGNI